MGKPIRKNIREIETNRPNRPNRPNANNDAGSQSDGSKTNRPIPSTNRPKDEPFAPVVWDDEPFKTDLPEPIQEPKPDRARPKPARRVRLTPELIASLEPEPKQFYVWDTKRKGLGVRVGASGTVAYVLKISLPGKRSAWLTMKARTLADAGIEYHEMLTKHGKGEPLPKRQADTLWQDAVDRFEREHLPTLKPTTQGTYKSALKLVRAGFKNRPVRSIVYGDVKEFHESLSDRARQANVAVSLAGIVLDRCEAWGLRDLNTNPVTVLRKSGWTPNPEHARQRPLSDDELGRIGDALRIMETLKAKDGEPKESRFTIAAVRLLLMTGKRLREILDLQWDQIDLPRRTIVWADSKTGRMEAPLNDATLAILQGLPRVTGNPFVLPGAEPGKPIQDLTKFWRRLLKMAGIVDLTRHDLRHAHGNEAGGLGLNLQIVALLLGHHDPHTSGRYSKPTQHPGLEASEQVSQGLARKLKGKR